MNSYLCNRLIAWPTCVEHAMNTMRLYRVDFALVDRSVRIVLVVDLSQWTVKVGCYVICIAY